MNSIKHCIILHLYYQDLWPEFKEKLLPVLSDSVHLYVTVIEETPNCDDIREIAKDLYIIENRGSDVAPFLYVYSKIQHCGYQTYLKIHGKKSLHTPGIGDEWRKSLYFPIIENYHWLLEQTLDEYSQAVPFMVGSSVWYHDDSREPKNHPNRLNISSYLNLALSLLNLTSDGSFFAGTMFLTNNAYLSKLFENINVMDLYDKFEIGYKSHSLAHGMERALGYGIHQYNGVYIKI